MARRQPSSRHQTRCQDCGQVVPSYDITNLGSPELGYRQLCSLCTNRDAAGAMGLEGFEDASFEPVMVRDAAGVRHRFHFRTNLFGPGVAINGFEVVDGYPGGYQFQVIGNPEEDLFVLFGKLIEKIRRHLAVRHLVWEDGCTRIADEGIVRAGITTDEDNDNPVLMIDGKEYSWDEFGQMLKTYAGWCFHLRIYDKSQE